MLLALPLLLALVVPAQARKPCYFTPCDDSGKPLAGAEITCVFSSSMVVIGSTDVVRATTDARGRAQPELRIGDTYTAWVIGSAGAEGRRWISDDRTRRCSMSGETEPGTCTSVRRSASG